ncbi:gliding motility-associated ABC transporter substrate-binding protein GldG [Deltaproteobacteria bacterium]|nr:gliding motility-associated ABC transporter substrate-binding protein GldG [Deltaproteobacteria bacterium]
MRAIGWILATLGVLAIMAWGASYLVLVKMLDLQEYPTALHGIGGAGFVLIGLWLFLDWGSLSALGKDQTVARAGMAGMLLLVATALLIVVNVVGNRYDKRWDLTSAKRYSLSEQSETVAKGLDKKVAILAFFRSGSPEESNFKELIKGYTEQNTLIEVNYYDPIGDNLIAIQEGITSEYGTVILRVGDVEQRLTSGFDEEGVTNAIVKATSTTSHSLCVVGGHGEGTADDEGAPEGFGAALGKLTRQNYTVSAVQLLAAQPTPADCEVLLLPGPKTDLSGGELDRLAQYVAAGGKMIALLDPMVTPNTAADMARYGVKVGADVVIEGDPYLQTANGPSFVMAAPSAFAAHPITEKLKDAVVFPLARSVAKGPEIAGITVTELIHTSDQSWAETNLEDAKTNPPSPEIGVDTVGHVSLMVAVEVSDPAAIAETTVAAVVPGLDGAPAIAAPPSTTDKLPKKEGGRVVVIGDGDFATNMFARQGVNQDLLLNSIGWMADDKNQITIHADDSKIGQLTVDLVPGAVAVLVAMIGVPGLAALGAVGMYLRRRNQ